VVVGIVTRDSGTQPVLEYFASEKNRALSTGWVPELQAQFFNFLISLFGEISPVK
jgi:hypothetical protein